MEVGNDSKRYYPSPMEQSILVQNVANYFSKPERSVERNKIAADVSQQLMKINNHWNHRAVRLWFNNNKHTYNGDTQTVNNQPPPQLNQPPPQLPLNPHQHVHFGDQSYGHNQQVGIPNQGMPLPPQMPGMPMQPVMPPSMGMNPQLQPPPEMQQLQQQQIQQMQQMPPMQPIPNPPQMPPMQNPTPMQLPPSQVIQQQPPPPPQKPAKINQQMVPSRSTFSPNYQQVILGLIKESVQATDEDMPQIIQKYERAIKEMKQSGQTVPIPFSIESKNSVVVPQSESPEFSFSNSSFSSLDSFQTRRFDDCFLSSQFDAAFVDKSCAAFVHMARLAPERALSYEFTDSPKFGKEWRIDKFNKTSRIEQMVVDSDHRCAWMLGGNKMLRLHLDPNQRLQSVDLTPNNTCRFPANLAVLNGRVVAGYSDTNILYFVDSRMKVNQVVTPFQDSNGFSALCAMEDSLLCGFIQSAAVRLIDENGAEIRSFIGHTETVIQIAQIADDVFLTASDDRSLNLWDIRQHAPIGHIGTNSKSVVAISGCPEYAVFATHSNQIHAFDLRGVPMKSAVCISTGEYQTSNMYYSPFNDSLCLFGIAAKDGNSDSLLFIDDQGSSRKYIFRRYQNFIHL